MNEKFIQMLAQYMQSAEPVSTKVEHGHTAIDKEIKKYKHTMSEDPGKQIIAPGLGMLEWAGTALGPGVKVSKQGAAALAKVLKDISLKRSANKSMRQLKMGTAPSKVKNLEGEAGILQLYEEWLKLMGKSKNYSRAENLYDTEMAILDKLK